MVGYSDTTALSLFLLRAGLVSIHGPMLDRDDLGDEARERLAALLRGEPAGQAPLGGKPLAAGRARGRLVGGNLRMLCASLGTPWEVDTRGAILFLEEVGEEPYAIDRSLGQLRDAGKLASLVGVAVGQLVDCESERYPEVSACDVVRDVLLPEIEGPIVADLPFGHTADNRALGVGVLAELDGDTGTLELVEPAVSKEKR
jgi:muramoyltetrapeptide carboxypeptidase